MYRFVYDEKLYKVPYDVWSCKGLAVLEDTAQLIKLSISTDEESGVKSIEINEVEHPHGDCDAYFIAQRMSACLAVPV